MTEWAWHCHDLATNASLATVPFERWASEDWLNDAGSWDAKLAPAEPGLARVYLNALRAGERTVTAVRTDDWDVTRVEFAGWVRPGGDRRPEYASTGLLGYLDSRPYVPAPPPGGSGGSWTATDQLIIAANIVDEVAGSIIDTGTVGTSGRLRDQSWHLWDAKPVGEALRQLAARQDGFDFAVRTEAEGTDLVRRLRAWYPRRGRAVDFAGPLTFEYGRNMLTVPQLVGNPLYATAVLALGETIDPDTEERLTSYVADATAPVLIVRTLDRSDITTQTGLDEAAAGALAESLQQQDALISFRVDPNDPSYRWGEWDLGDDCYVVLPDDASPWWPDGIAEVRRVLAHRWEVDETGERLFVTTGRAWEAS